MRVSLRTRMIALIVLPTLAIYVVMLGFLILRFRADARNQVEAEITRLAAGYAARFDGAFREAAAVATSTARFMEAAGDRAEPEIFAQLTANTLHAPSIYGAAMAFEPGTVRPAGELYCPYVHRRGDTVNRMFISRDVYDWYGDEQWQWWHLPKKSGSGAWTDPYFDEGAGNVLMVTFSAPFFSHGSLRGVTTIDILLPTLRQSIGAEIAGNLDFFILTPGGKFVFSPDVGDIMTRTVFDVAEEIHEPELTRVGERVAQGAPGGAVVDGWGSAGRQWVFFAPIESTGWSFVARVSEDQVMAPVRSRTRWAAGALAFTLALIVSSIWLVSGWITSPIARLRSKVIEIAGGDLEARVEGISRKDEIGDLAASFNQMTHKLRAQVDRLATERAARDKIERDLDIAREIQRGLLPRTAPDLPGFQIAGWNQAADKTGGDFFDWLQLPDGRTIVTLADVSGHGIGPALIVAVCRAYLRASATGAAADICEAVNRVNALLYEDIPDGKFVTAAVGIIDAPRKRMALLSAGQGPILFYEASANQVHVWDADAPPLGVMEDLECSSCREFSFGPGDMLILVTDGFFEWFDPQRQQYGTERLIEFTLRHNKAAPADFIQALHADVLAFAHGTLQADDLTALIIRCSG